MTRTRRSLAIAWVLTTILLTTLLLTTLLLLLPLLHCGGTP